eukprot:scaffold431_cov142-Skeletonema_menzelii.AAC.14
MQKFVLIVLFVATISKADAWGWGECPKPEADAKYSDACYKATQPPSFVCNNMTPDEWVEKALESYPRCCAGDLTECKCPVKDYWFFKNKIDDYCAKVGICEPPAIVASDSSVPSGGSVTFLRG